MLYSADEVIEVEGGGKRVRSGEGTGRWLSGRVSKGQGKGRTGKRTSDVRVTYQELESKGWSRNQLPKQESGGIL